MASLGIQEFQDELNAFNSQSFPEHGDVSNDAQDVANPDIQHFVVDARRQPVAAPRRGCGCLWAVWAVVCAIGRILWLAVQLLLAVFKLPSKLFTIGFPDEFFGYRSRWWCRRTRDGQPVPPHPNDFYATLLWMPFLTLFFVGLILSLVMTIETPATSQSWASAAASWTWGTIKYAGSIIWWESASAAIGIPVYTTLITSFPAGVMAGAGVRWFGWDSFAAYANGIAGLGGFALGVRSYAVGEIRDVLYNLSLMLFTVGIAVGQNLRRMTMFMCCCYAVRPTPPRGILKNADEAVLSSTTKTHMARSFMVAAGSSFRKIADVVDGGADRSVHFAPEMGPAEPSYRMRQQWDRDLPHLKAEGNEA